MEAISSVLLAREIRRSVLRESKRANVGHIGSCLSVADILAALFGGPLAQQSPRSADNDRDRFVLSKGHAALALYAALVLTNRLDRASLHGFCTDGSSLGTHPEVHVAGVDFATGSLGVGLSIAAGAAYAAKMQKSRRRAFALVSDAECNEGSLWEAVMFAAHHRLSNLVAIVDANGQQALGYTNDVLSLEPLGERWRAFGWDVQDVDGHDVDLIGRTLDELNTADGPPHVLIAHTVFGKGVPYMENKIEWHYKPMSDDEYAEALGSIVPAS